MPGALSVASVIDKNKITSGAVWVTLLEMKLIDPNTRELSQTIRIAQNNEPIVFMGNTYAPANFEISISQRKGEAPSVSMNAKDKTGILIKPIDDMAGGVFSTVVMTIVNTQRLDQPSEIEMNFEVLSTNIKGYDIAIELGAENPLRIQFPRHTQRQDRCAWRYKGYGCGYSGTLATCDYTAAGPNGCGAHENLENFRALRGLVRMNI